MKFLTRLLGLVVTICKAGLVLIIISLCIADQWLLAMIFGLVLVALMWVTRPAGPDSLITPLLQGYLGMSMQDWQVFERKAAILFPRHPVRDLIYALRVASVVPTITRIPTLASRWETAHYGAAGRGLNAARGTPHYPAVQQSLHALFYTRLHHLLEQQTSVWVDAPGPLTDRQLAKAEKDLREWQRQFLTDSHVFAPLFSHYLDLAAGRA